MDDARSDEIQPSSEENEARRVRPRDDRVHYTTFIRLPFPRGDFEDPPLIDWDATKDKALWKILSNNPKSSELDWKELASRFDVTLPFILQQAAWLYERQLSQVREQMRRVSKTDIAADEAESDAAGRHAGPSASQRRASTQFATSPLGLVKEPRAESTVGSAAQSQAQQAILEPAAAGLLDLPIRGQATPITRTASSNTVTQSSHRPPSRGGLRSKASFQRGTPPDKGLSPKMTSRRASQQTVQRPRTPSPPSQSSTSSSSDSEEEQPQPKRSQYLRRPAKFTAARRPSFRGAASRAKLPSDEDEEDEPPFLPFAQAADEHSDMGATLRGQVQRQDSNSQTDASSDAAPAPETTRVDSSVSSAASSAAPMQHRDTPSSQRSPESHTLSPRHRAEPAALNPRKKGKGREGSDGTPSMGSSFSDLDDTSVTQSALEEALLSNVQKGVASSRISNLSQALRSRYQGYSTSNQRQP